MAERPKPFVRDSVEYYKFSLDDRDGKDLTTATVQCAIEPKGSIADPTWIDCTWLTGKVWRTTAPLTFSKENYPPVHLNGWARVADNPETPRVDLGRVFIEEL